MMIVVVGTELFDSISAKRDLKYEIESIVLHLLDNGSKGQTVVNITISGECLELNNSMTYIKAVFLNSEASVVKSLNK